MAIGSATASPSTSTPTSATKPPTTAAQSSTTTNLQNLLLQYAASESRDVQDLLVNVARQLGLNITEVRAAARKDIEAREQAKQAAEKAPDPKAMDAAADAIRTRRAREQSERAADEYRRHRMNNWQSSYARQAAVGNASG